MKLTDSEIEQALQRVPEWKLDGKFITRRYSFAAFPDAIRFVTQVADIAEARNHHPFISIDYKKVTLRLTSWHHGGLTEADFAEAEACDEAFDSFSK